MLSFPPAVGETRTAGVRTHERRGNGGGVTASHETGNGNRLVRAPMAGTVIAVDVDAGQSVPAGATLAVIEAMKMHHPLRAPQAGRVEAVAVKPGDVVAADEVVVVALARINGKPLGVIANDPAVLGGAIGADGADKLARFLHLCDAFGLPIVSLCDTPGFMVGPDAEETATVRHFARLFVLGGHMTIPIVTVVVHTTYGLGAMGMAAGSMYNTSAAVAWPTGEFGGMNLEGAVRIAARNELSAITDPDERQRAYDEMVAAAYAQGNALNAASYLEIDEVIDPADTRDIIAAAALGGTSNAGGSWANPQRRTGVDTW